MHAEAMDFLKRITICGDVLEIGSRIINGSARDAFPDKTDMEWVGVDIVEGPGVHIVADATDSTWRPMYSFCNVICCEVLEHCERWREIIRNAYHYLTPGGLLIVTCAGPGRKPHSAIDGGPLRDGESYANVSAVELRQAMLDAGFAMAYTRQVGRDTQGIAVRRDHG